MPGSKWRRTTLVVVLVFVVALLAAVDWVWQRYQTERIWENAQNALRAHDLESATDCFNQYLKRRPDDSAAWFLAARTLRRQNKLIEAESYLERCQQIGGVTDGTRLEWNLIHIQQGDLRDFDLRLRATIGPNHPDALYVLEALAQGYLKSERLKDAYQACEMWLERKPDDPGAWMWRGRLFEHTSNWSRAEADFRRALELAPRLVDAHLALGSVLLHTHQPVQAEQHFDYVLRRFQDNSRAMLGLASCKIAQGELDSGSRLLDQIANRESASPEYLFLRGKIEFQHGDYSKSEECLSKTLQLDPADADALYLLVQCLRARACDLDADKLAARLDSLRIDLRRLDELVKKIAEGQDAIPLRVEAGAIASRIGRPKDSLRWFKSALLGAGDHRAAHIALAKFYEQSGDLPNADAHRRLAE